MILNTNVMAVTSPTVLPLLFRTALIYALMICAPSAGASVDLTKTLTVLTYHNIAADPGDNRFTQSRSSFVAQMDYLQTHGYQPISLAQLEEYRKFPERLPAKPIIW